MPVRKGTCSSSVCFGCFYLLFDICIAEVCILRESACHVWSSVSTEKKTLNFDDRDSDLVFFFLYPC